MSESLVDNIRTMLWEKWDPIGVNQYPEANDEYDDYAPTLAKLILNGGSETEIFNLLWSIETSHMGLDGDEQATLGFARTLSELVHSERSEGSS